MNNYQKFGIVAGQVFMGVDFAILGGIAGLVIDYIISLTSGIYSDLSGSIMNALIGCFIGLLIGILFDGYKFLKKNGRQNEFVKFLLVSVLGVLSGLLALYVALMNSNALGAVFFIFLSVVLPVLGTILGSIAVLIREKVE
jgi:hypothetical protein